MHQELENAFSLKGRCAVVTGAASGIGKQTAITLAQAGAHVILADVDEGGLAATRAAVEGAGGVATTRKVDVTNRDAMEALADFAVETVGRLDVWANIAGVILTVPIMEATEAQIDKLFDVNMKGTFIDTPMIAYRYRTPDGGLDEAKHAAILEDRAKGSVLGITGEPTDIAYAILYLASDAARFVTGQVMRPNGGVAMPA